MDSRAQTIGDIALRETWTTRNFAALGACARDADDEYWGEGDGGFRLALEGVESGYEEYLALPNGICLQLRDASTTAAQGFSYVGEDMAKFHIRMSGTSVISMPHTVEASRLSGPAFGTLTHPADMPKHEYVLPGDRQKWLTILLPRHHLETIFLSNLKSFPTGLAGFARRSRTDAFMDCRRPNLELIAAAQALFSTAWTRSLRRLIFEAKTLEILGLIGSELSCDSATASKPVPLSQRERAKLGELRERLARDYADPPGIAELSRELGMNQDKIVKGFRQMFGETITAACLGMRMRHALDLLRDGQTISAVSEAVGYAYVSNFSTAFKRHFGVAPSRLDKIAD